MPLFRRSFLVTFSAVIESGSNAKLCASLLKPNESLALTIYLVDDKNRTTQLVQQRSSTEFHRCFSFQAPHVDGELVQKLRVVLQGRFFKMTEERKVLFRRYLPLTFIQTDKPIYNPGQMVNFRVVTMDAKFVPLDQMDNHNNRIGQWTNVSSTGWILQLSHQLNPEAQVGMYTLRAFIGDRMMSQVFEVKKYVLPKFDVTLIAPLMYSVGDVGLKVEACANYTYGQPVPGQALVEVCREPFPYAVVPGLSRVCLIKTAMMNKTGCVSLTISMSEFFNTKFGNDLQDLFLVNVNVTEEGTDVMMSKSTTVSITFEVGKVTFLDLPGFFTYGSIINGKISASYFNGTPIASKAVHLLDGSQWPNKLLLNLTTNMNGLTAFSLNTADLPKADLNLVASATSQVVYGYKSPYFSTDTRTVPLFQTATPNNPTFSELTIVKFEQPLKCGAKYPVTVKYSFVGETGDYSADIIYMVLSRGVIVLHGFQKVQVRALHALKSGTVPFELSVSLDMAPVVQILAFCVLPSENVVAASAAFDTEMCFQNQVSLQFSPPMAVPSEGNVLTVSAQAGSLCGLSAVDQSIRIMEPGRRLSAQAVFDLLPVRSLSDLYPVEDEQECLNVRPRRAVPAGQAYEVFKDPIITNALSCLRPVVGNLGNTYTTALLAYTFSLAGETSTRAQLLNALDNVAISEGTKLHWSQTTSGDTLAVEISSYVLLAVLSVQPLTTANLGYANRIVNWLVAHQNPYGGFSSTQDTVVALHALSLLAAEVFSLEGSSTVTVQSSSVAGEVYNFNVNRDNRLLYQEKPLKNVPGRYSVRGKGSTCVSVQVACLYNIPTPIKASRTLSVEVKVARDCKVHGADLVLNITVKYNGAKPTTNMVIVNVKLLSGFTADTSLLGSPLDTFAPLVQRVDTGDDHVLVYLKEVPKGAPVTYRLQLKQVLAVQNLKPAVVEVYDYYQPSDVFETTYMPPCP